jgi:hypothetical protein
MLEATARYKTEHARKYLTQVCKHFAHKLDVSYADDHGECRFSFGSAILDSDAEALNIRVTVSDGSELPRAKSVIEDHLMRFAFREPVKSLDWSA